MDIAYLQTEKEQLASPITYANLLIYNIDIKQQFTVPPNL